MAAASANEGDFEIVCNGNSSTCLDALLDEMPELQYIEVPDDGDCFFHSIAAYYKRTGRQVDGLVNPTDSQELREFVAEQFLIMFENDPGLRNSILNRNHNDVFRLSEQSFWEGDVCDLMIQRIPRILNINLNVYGVNRLNVKQDSPFAITRSSHVPIHHVNNIPTINLFLSEGHYGLLYPVGGDNVRSPAQIRANDRAMVTYKAKKTKEHEAEVKEAYKQEAAAKAKAAKAAKAKVKAPAKAKAPRNNNFNAALEASHYNINNNIAELEREVEAAERRAALRAQAKAKANAALAKSFSAISFNSRNNRNKLEQQNALNGSRRKSIKKKPPVADLCKGMTIQVIRQYLLSMGVGEDAMPPKMSKKDLCELYLSFREFRE